MTYKTSMMAPADGPDDADDMCLGMSHDLFLEMHRSDAWQAHFDDLCCDAS